MDTDMVANVTAAKSDPAVIAARALDGLELGLHEVIADERSRAVRAKLSGKLTELYPGLAEPSPAPPDRSGARPPL